MQARIVKGLLVAGALLCACGSDRPAALTSVRTISVGLNLNALEGNGDVLGVSYTDVSNTGSTTGFRETLHLYKYQSVTPDDLLDLGNVYLGVDRLYHRVPHISFSADWAAVTIDFNDGPKGWVGLVSLGGAAPSLAATLPLNYVVDGALAAGRWLLVVGGQRLDLFDLVNSSSPSLIKTFTSAGPVTAFTVVADGFIVFTDSGYGHLVPDSTNATYSETPDTTLRSFRKAYTYAGQAYVAGPSPLAGKSRIARLDLRDPGRPALALSLDVEGNFVGFGYDGSSRYFLELTGNDLGDRALVYREDQAGLTLVANGSMRPWFGGGVSRLFARNGHVYLLDRGLGIYRLP